MRLAVDIGNTNITFGIVDDSARILKTFDIPTNSYRKSILKDKLKASKITTAIVASVVPRVEKTLSKDLKLFAQKILVVGKDVRVPIKNLYRYPQQVGQDRLVNAYAAVQLYGTPVICVDFGTAITFDTVSKRREYLGGMILPGLRISLEALNKNTALLPKIKLSAPREFIGRETAQSMLSGVVIGTARMTDELIRLIRKKIGKNASSVATGGDAELVSRYCSRIEKVDSYLTLKGLTLILTLYKGSYNRL